nr:phytanoyl-CoA dioxygenase family protein [Hyphomonas sp. Mor2]
MSNDIGWKNTPKTDPEVIALREHLLENNGIKDLEIYTPKDMDAIVSAFDRDGFVLVGDILNDEQIEILASGCNKVIQEILSLDDDGSGNRGSHRYSFGGSSKTRSQLHEPAWQMMLNVKTVTDIVSAIFRSDNYILRAASGDFCLPGATEYQPLHSDVRDWADAKKSPFSSFQDPRGILSIKDLPCPYVCVNFLPQDITPLNGPTRQIPGTQNSRAKIPTLDEEPEWMRLSTVCPAPAGTIMIRDVRAWHGGTPNLTDQVRAIPNLEFYAPWFREPIVPGISYDDYNRLSERAQQLAQFSVLDSGKSLETGAVLYAK